MTVMDKIFAELFVDTPIRYVEGRVWKISGKCLLFPAISKGGNGARITNPKIIAEGHVAAVDNPSSAYFSAWF